MILNDSVNRKLASFFNHLSQQHEILLKLIKIMWEKRKVGTTKKQ